VPTIALVTYPRLPALAPDEHPLIASLATLGIRAIPTVWDDPSVEWTRFDAAVIRSCWDYHLRPAQFFDWVAMVERAGVAIWNPPAVLRWNSRKTYLRDLAAAGVHTVPTVWLGGGPRADLPSLETILAEAGWDDAVVKPVVSASAHETWRLSRAEAHDGAGADDRRLHALIAREGVMVQPFIPQIATNGEWSLQFFGGVFSHAVIKRAAPGEFRVQREFGGTHERVTPPATVLDDARAALRAAPADTLYARVDGVVIDGGLIVTELELLEPSLFLDADPTAPGRFAAAIAMAVGGRQS